MRMEVVCLDRVGASFKRCPFLCHRVDQLETKGKMLLSTLMLRVEQNFPGLKH